MTVYEFDMDQVEQMNRMNRMKFGDRMMTLNQAIPDETKDRLIFLGNQESDIQWESGDITDVLLRYVSDDPRVDVDDMMVYKFVAGLLGCAESTVRYRVYTCREFSHDERNRYYPQLTFKHFFTAKQFGDRKFEVLDACLRYMDTHNGKRPGTDWITRMFRGVTQVEEMEDRTYETTIDIPQIDAPDRFNTVTVWRNILTSTSYIRDRLMQAEVSPERREELGEMLDEFESEIRSELEQ